MTSWQEKIRDAADKATENGKLDERLRVLEIFAAYIAELEQNLEKKVLIEKQRHLIETKVQLVRVIVRDVAMRVKSGMTVAKHKCSNGHSYPTYIHGGCPKCGDDEVLC